MKGNKERKEAAAARDEQGRWLVMAPEEGRSYWQPEPASGHVTVKAESAGWALGDSTLGEVIDSRVVLKYPREFAEFKRVDEDYFKGKKPVRSVFRTEFMLEFRVEMKVTAYKPL